MGKYLLCSIVDAFEDLAERSFTDALLLCEYQFGIDFLRQRIKREKYEIELFVAIET